MSTTSTTDPRDTASVAGDEPVSHRLAQQFAPLSFDALPDEVVTVAKHCVLDWLGCAIAGSREPLSHLLRDTLADPGDSHVGRDGSASDAVSGATVLGECQGYRPIDAALLNGAAGHALDFDDTHLSMHGHPTAPVLPAVLALGEVLGSPGADVLTALVVGIEVELRIARLLGGEHYRNGWHMTGTAGVFGAAAGCAHLLGLDRERWGHALGLAGTQAGGLKSSFGTMAKPLHAGRAAADGLFAARLAGNGFVGQPAIVEMPQGLVDASTRRDADPAVVDRDADRWFIRDVLFKYHASCYGTHSTINAVLDVADELPAPPASSVERVDVTVSPDLLRMCAISEPTTGLEGKFSLRAVTAMALLGDATGDPNAFTDERMRSADLVAMRDRVAIATQEDLGGSVSHVRIACTDGRHLDGSSDSGIPAADLAVQGSRLHQKFDGLAGSVHERAAVSRVAGLVDDLERVPAIAELLRVLR